MCLLAGQSAGAPRRARPRAPSHRPDCAVPPPSPPRPGPAHLMARLGGRCRCPSAGPGSAAAAAEAAPVPAAVPGPGETPGCGAGEAGPRRAGGGRDAAPPSFPSPPPAPRRQPRPPQGAGTEWSGRVRLRAGGVTFVAARSANFFFFLEVEMLQLAALTFKTVVVVIVMSCQYFTGTSEMSPFSLVVAFCFKGRHFVALKFPILYRYLGSLLLTTEVLGTALGEQRALARACSGSTSPDATSGPATGRPSWGSASPAAPHPPFCTGKPQLDTPEPSLLQAEHIQLFQPYFIWQVVQT